MPPQMRNDGLVTERPGANDDRVTQSDSASGQQGGLYDGFEAYRTPTDADYQGLLTGGMVVPDTNVFLNLYRYNAQARDDLLLVLRGLGDRLWVPYNVIREFWRNRESLLQDPRDVGRTTHELTKHKEVSVATFRSWANRIGLPGEQITKIASILTLAFDTVIGEVAKAAWEDAIEFGRDTFKDPVLTELEDILQGRVGVPMDEAEYQKALAEAAVRAETKRPPGYVNARKGIPGGDYLTWAEVLQKAKRQRQDVLFVTADTQEDWWLRQRGQLRGPRPELVEEMKKVAGVRLFMLRPESLLVHARQVLGVKVRDESVQDIERVDRLYQAVLDAAMGRAAL
jgi:hypothetical protein